MHACLSGQPCCIVQWEINLGALEFSKILASKVFNASSQGGYDGLFSFVSSDPPLIGKSETAFGQCSYKSVSATSGEAKVPCALFKGFHIPEGSRMQKQSDELSFAVYATSPTSCTIKAMSRTKLVSVNCDEGRNYQNLQNVMLNLGVQSYVETTLYGCPQKR